ALHGIQGRKALRLLHLATTGRRSRVLGGHAAELREAMAYARGKVESELKNARPLEWLHYQQGLLAEATKAMERNGVALTPAFYQLVREMKARLQPYPDLAEIFRQVSRDVILTIAFLDSPSPESRPRPAPEDSSPDSE